MWRGHTNGCQLYWTSPRIAGATVKCGCPACPEPDEGLTSNGGGFSPAHRELVEGYIARSNPVLGLLLIPENRLQCPGAIHSRKTRGSILDSDRSVCTAQVLADGTPGQCFPNSAGFLILHQSRTVVCLGYRFKNQRPAIQISMEHHAKFRRGVEGNQYVQFSHSVVDHPTPG